MASVRYTPGGFKHAIKNAIDDVNTTINGIDLTE
jgi:hypothetical protein